ncbi:MAG TPA: SDR family NAD(P)-dependent oxidoreductase [Burkholderiaceae bacterium]|jgi:NAD(P)-dependent dehydrogenase (short-subunit alcohol dehydrogenase family)
MKDFKDRVAVVTGAANGIGRAIAERCAAEGMKVVLAGINEENLAKVERDLKARGATVMSVRTDVSKKEDVEALAQKTLDAFGAVHLLVNNAGVGAGTTAWDSSWNDWEWVIDVNLWGVIHGVKIFTPIMLAQKDACHIVNTSSVAGLLAYHPSATYHMTKHAVVALSENMQLSLEQQNANVKVSVLCPGWVKTGILDSARNRPAHLQNPPVTPTPEQVAAWQSMVEKLEASMPASEAADHVFKAIVEERFYVLTHPEYTSMIEERMANLVNGNNPKNPLRQ